MYMELVERLRNCATQAAPCKICDMIEDRSCSDTLMKQAADAIEELIDKLNHADDQIERLVEAAEERRWIPVAERLPEFDQKVLAWVKNKDPEGRFNKDGIYTAELKDKVPKPDPKGKRNFWGIPGYDSVWTVWSWSYFTEPDVLFWMPLPEPPKEGTE